jgi:hypothetical protein
VAPGLVYSISRSAEGLRLRLRLALVQLLLRLIRADAIGDSSARLRRDGSTAGGGVAPGSVCRISRSAARLRALAGLLVSPALLASCQLLCLVGGTLSLLVQMLLWLVSAATSGDSSARPSEDGSEPGGGVAPGSVYSISRSAARLQALAGLLALALVQLLLLRLIRAATSGDSSATLRGGGS